MTHDPVIRPLGLRKDPHDRWGAARSSGLIGAASSRNPDGISGTTFRGSCPRPFSLGRSLEKLSRRSRPSLARIPSYSASSSTDKPRCSRNSPIGIVRSEDGSLRRVGSSRRSDKKIGVCQRSLMLVIFKKPISSAKMITALVERAIG